MSANMTAHARTPMQRGAYAPAAGRASRPERAPAFAALSNEQSVCLATRREGRDKYCASAIYALRTRNSGISQPTSHRRRRRIEAVRRTLEILAKYLLAAGHRASLYVTVPFVVQRGLPVATQRTGEAT
jgi:hypothetical protein